MATLSDTPTQTLLNSTSEAGNVSIKIEQGVLPESDEYVNGSRCYSAERRDIQINTTYDSSTTNDMDNFLNGMGGSSTDEFNISHSIFQENIKIKVEPSVDIDDRHPENDESVEETSSSFESRSQNSNEKITPPKIRLTPTSKLIASPDSSGIENKRRYACTYENCTKNYGRSSHLKSHLTWHTGVKPFVCNEAGCDKSFTRSDELSRHIKAHAKKLIAKPNDVPEIKKRYACPYENCTKSYGKSSHLRSHLTWHTGIKPFVCKEPGCGKGFTRSDELNRHIRTHTGEKPFECAQCPKKFSRSDHLTKHIATHTKQLVLANKLLAKKTKSYEHLPEASVEINSPVTVPAINKEEYYALNNNNFPNNNFTSTNNCEVITDQKMVEQKNEVKIKLENPDYDTMNVIAAKWERTELSSSLGVQSAIANIKMETEAETETDISVKPEPLEENRKTQTRHQFFEEEPDDDAIMPEANLPPLIQTVKPPQAETAVKSSFKRSTEAVHDPTRPHPCTHCTKSFKRQDDLNRHMRTHTGEKPFACLECDKRFMRSDHLKKHMNTHIRMYKNRMIKDSPAELLPPLTQSCGP